MYRGRKEMGCNIHGIVEVKNEHGNWWSPYLHEPLSDRWYSIFARLANVRNRNQEIEPISEPRGLPENTTKTFKYKELDYDGDAHSHSWVGGEELLSISVEHINDVWLDWLKLVSMIIIQHGAENVRFVFFFDN